MTVSLCKQRGDQFNITMNQCYPLLSDVLTSCLNMVLTKSSTFKAVFSNMRFVFNCRIRKSSDRLFSTLAYYRRYYWQNYSPIRRRFISIVSHPSLWNNYCNTSKVVFFAFEVSKNQVIFTQRKLNSNGLTYSSHVKSTRLSQVNSDQHWTAQSLSRNGKKSTSLFGCSLVRI